MDRAIPGLFTGEEWAKLAGGLHLSRRQTQTARGLLQAMGDKQIASQLGVSVHTVRTHLNRMFAKLQTQDRGELVVRLFREFRAGCFEVACPRRH